jgi:hypothetical protein
MGSELYRACKLPVPTWKPLLVTDSFLDQNPDCWIQTGEGCLRPQSGLCFGSQFLGNNGVQTLEVLPGSSLKRVRNHGSFWLAWVIDICAKHADNRQALFLKNSTQKFTAYFIDHGHLFGGPQGKQNVHFLTSRYLDPRIYQNVSPRYFCKLQKTAEELNSDDLWKRAQALPEDWKTASAFDGLTQALNRLSSATLLQGILDTMADAQQRSMQREHLECDFKYELPAIVLYPRVQSTGRGPSRIVRDASYPACS